MSVLLIPAQPYYNYFDHHMYPASTHSRSLTMHTPLSTFPVLIQGGSILPIRQRVRRASELMWQDPFTLIVTLGKDGSSSGQLYLDDGVGYGYLQGEYVWRDFKFTSSGKGGSLISSDRAKGQSEVETQKGVTVYDDSNPWAKSIAHVKVERIVILGMKSEPKTITVAGQALEWTWTGGVASGGKKEGQASELVIKNPGVGVVSGWELDIA